MQAGSEFKILYKLDSKNKVRTWSIKTYEENGIWYYEQTHGLKDGKQQTTRTAVTEGKNIGKANETTPQEQCRAEALSLWNEKFDRKGYVPFEPDGESQVFETFQDIHKRFSPMLAKDYTERKNKLSFPVYCQPKLDGIRCIAMYDELTDTIILMSRQGKKFTVLKHIEDALLPILKDRPKLVLDGELYNHEFCEDFQGLVSGIKRDKANDKTGLVEYHVYDIINDDTYSVRKQILCGLLFKKPVVKVETSLPALDHDDIDSLRNHYTSCGYEGAMVRTQYGKYKRAGRSSDLLKYKVFQDQEFKIVDAKTGKGKFNGMCIFVCETKEGHQFRCMPEGSADYRRQLLKDWEDGKIKVGDMLTVKYFSMTTSDKPVPRFPVGRLRDYE